MLMRRAVGRAGACVAVPELALRPVLAITPAAASVRFDSTHRKRRRMMNKHKLRKLRKKMRNIGGANQKSR